MKNCMNTLHLLVAKDSLGFYDKFKQKLLLNCVDPKNSSMANLVDNYHKNSHPVNILFKNCGYYASSDGTYADVAAFFIFDTENGPPEDWYSILIDEYGGPENVQLIACFYNPDEKTFGVYNSESLFIYMDFDKTFKDFANSEHTSIKDYLMDYLGKFNFPENWIDDIVLSMCD